MEESGSKKQHFVLVHGACHGAWSWYKLTALLTSAGHRVTALDLAAAGIDPRQLPDVATFADYSEPLLKILASILVGHSFGGMTVGLAMDRYPEKIAVAVFVAAFMPDCTHKPSYVLDEYHRRTPKDALTDSQFNPGPPPSMKFGPNYLSSNLYQCSSLEDRMLAMMLVRPILTFSEDLSNLPIYSKQRYGSIPRAYIIADEDKAIIKDLQLWMIDNDPVEEVKEIKGSDHFPMISKPRVLCKCLLEIANKFS